MGAEEVAVWTSEIKKLDGGGRVEEGKQNLPIKQQQTTKNKDQ